MGNAFWRFSCDLSDAIPPSKRYSFLRPLDIRCGASASGPEHPRPHAFFIRIGHQKGLLGRRPPRTSANTEVYRSTITDIQATSVCVRFSMSGPDEKCVRTRMFRHGFLTDDNLRSSVWRPYDVNPRNFVHGSLLINRYRHATYFRVRSLLDVWAGCKKHEDTDVPAWSCV